MTDVLAVKRETETCVLPVRSTPGSIGYDVFADLPFHTEGLIIPPGKRKLISLGFSMACPNGTYARLAPRSGLAVKKGLHVMAGVIDPDYRGEVKVLLLNTSDDPAKIRHGDRIAQMILERASVVPLIEVETLSDTSRGFDGFGSSGM